MSPTETTDAEFFKQLFQAAPDAVVVVDTAGTIRLANAQAEVLLGWDPADLSGRPLEVLLPASLKERHARHRTRFVENPVTRPMAQGADLVAVRADGTEVPVDISLSPISAGDQRFIVASIRDATARRAVEEQLTSSEERMRASLESMLDGFAVMRAVRERGRIVDFEWTFMNTAGAATFGRTPEELIGVRVSEVQTGAEAGGVLDGYRRVVETGQAWESSSYAYSDDAVHGVFDFRAWRLGDSLAVTWRDVTDRTLAAEAVRRSEERFRGSVEHLQDALSVFTAIRDESGAVVDFRWDYANVQACATTGRDADELVGRTLLEVLPALAPAGVLEAYKHVVDTGETWTATTLWIEEHWGSRGWARRAFDVRATRLHDGVVVVWRDVTEQREHDERLAIRRAELERSNREIRTLNELGDLLQSCTTADEAFSVAARILGDLFPQLGGGFAISRQGTGLLDPVASWGSRTSESTMFAPNDCWALRRGQPHISGRMAPRCPHLGDDVHQAVCTPMVGQGETIGVLHIEMCEEMGLTESDLREEIVPLATTVARQVALAAANLELRDRLHDLSIRDPLTGLFNRRYMEETLAREVARAARQSSQVAVLQFDIDNFKAYNDRFGHGAGDAILVAVARALETGFRSSDVVCRYGGEEFTVILPECDDEDAVAHADALRERIGELRVGHAGAPLPTTAISCGVAVYPDHASTPEKLLRAADSALYAAKHRGRNRVESASNGSSIA